MFFFLAFFIFLLVKNLQDGEKYAILRDMAKITHDAGSRSGSKGGKPTAGFIFGGRNMKIQQPVQLNELSVGDHFKDINSCNDEIWCIHKKSSILVFYHASGGHVEFASEKTKWVVSVLSI